ncbi:MBOAT family O-acyltransferase [Pedobacter duraquae]|uniref:D-alanyl-lipoteichoic acid acyltransferase DltB (MBOAT superfamily) n=1 Tax=Pedobacter duraquae TaxID=425511 RepID=A0A4R6IF10_9SPHI|nr:MBOAT family O-acyltransferase [Pedobacter duraquae]TDO20217.1 D-alanyl-lipoteichoic acid acyltransferase DltB (MBOAT superfamily) [Pedobacter duraquae]
MLFNSLSFALFLPVVFILYWFATKGNLRWQNILLLASSYFFYGCWDWRFMLLLIFSTLLDYFTGIKIYESNTRRRRLFWLWLSIGINLGFLGVFKYYNFFAASFVEGLNLLGFQANISTLKILLPVGISFYTFHGLSYVIDLYKKRITPERNFIDYSLFVSFFPLLVAGPIERATHLLPQIKKKRVFDYADAVDGLKQILWGLFKKMVIADNLAQYANTIFNQSEGYAGSTLLLGALFFTIQIYCDFSGYSDIALGTARLFGMDLLRNFAFPYFSRDIAEFWRRWHISLSSWFKDYLYIPLGGSKGGMWMKIRNTFIIFLVSGFWHGANWTFIVWGFLNALYIMPSIILNTNRNNLDIVAKGKYFPTIREFFAMLITFSLTTFAWIFFRADNLNRAFSYISTLFSPSLFTSPNQVYFSEEILVLTGLFFIVEWFGREQQYAIAAMCSTWKRPFRWAVYILIIMTICLYGGHDQTFIYFQF